MSSLQCFEFGKVLPPPTPPNSPLGGGAYKAALDERNRSWYVVGYSWMFLKVGKMGS